MIKGTEGVKVKGGICADCRYRSQLGAKGVKKHLYCNFSHAIVKNPKKKGCPNYMQASDEKLWHDKHVLGYGGIGNCKK